MPRDPADELVAGFATRAQAARERFALALRDARTVQTRLLLDECVHRNDDTVFGREHGFAAIDSVESFIERVPIRSYDDFAPYIDRVVAGEERVLTAERPSSLSRTSGTSGRAKAIISTQRYRDEHDVPRVLMANGYLLARFPELASRHDTTINFIRDPGPARAEAADRSSGGVPYRSYVANFARQAPSALQGELGTLAPWSQVPSHLSEERDRHYFRMRMAVGRDLLSLIALNPSTLVTFGRLVQESLLRLAAEVAAGTVLGEPLLPPDPRRAAELQALAARPDARPRDVWPNLQVISCWTAASCALYLPEVQALYGPIPIAPVMTNSSEGPIAVSIDAHPRAGALVVTDVFYEFAPVDQELTPRARTLRFDQLEVGGEYELIMTQPNGLYRYAIGDVLRVVGHVHEVPLVEFVGRKGVASSFTGEKLTEIQVLRATEAAIAAVGLSVVDATCCPRWGQPPHYVLAVEPTAALGQATLDALGEAFDRELGVYNDEYAGKRASGRLGPARARALSTGTFVRQRQRSIAAGASPVQLKRQVVQRAPTALDDLVALSEAGQERP